MSFRGKHCKLALYWMFSSKKQVFYYYWHSAFWCSSQFRFLYFGHFLQPWCKQINCNFPYRRERPLIRVRMHLLLMKLPCMLAYFLLLPEPFSKKLQSWVPETEWFYYSYINMNQLCWWRVFEVIMQDGYNRTILFFVAISVIC